MGILRKGDGKMFGWAKRLFSRKPAEDFAVYNPAERVIYSYFDGEKVVKADPMVLYRNLHDIGAVLDMDMKGARSQSSRAGEYHAEMIRKMRGIFAVKPLEQGGLTESETENLFWHFFEFCETVKKNSRSIRTNATEASSPTPASPGESPATGPSSASTSTAEGPSTEGPSPSPSVPESPSA